MANLPAPLTGVKGSMKIHDPRALLLREHEQKSSFQKGEIQLRVEVPQRLVAMEERLASMEATLEGFRIAIEMLQTPHAEPVKRGPGRPPKIRPEVEETVSEG
jgi:hypothetical protein